MSGPIVRTGTTPKFWENWDRVFGDKAEDKPKGKAVKGKKAGAKKATKKKAPAAKVKKKKK